MVIAVDESVASIEKKLASMIEIRSLDVEFAAEHFLQETRSNH